MYIQKTEKCKKLLPNNYEKIFLNRKIFAVYKLLQICTLNTERNLEKERRKKITAIFENVMEKFLAIP